jgi:Short C-terminal domain
MARKERPVAVIAPSMRSIKLYADGRIDYQGKSGSVIGATARLEKSGEKHRLRDTRTVVLRIDGPKVAIAAPLPAAAFELHRHAQDFVARVNRISNGGDGSAPAVRSAPAPPKTTAAAGPVEPDQVDVLMGRLERLGRLRDSGVLTEDEFQDQKAALLRDQ